MKLLIAFAAVGFVFSSPGVATAREVVITPPIMMSPPPSHPANRQLGLKEANRTCVKRGDRSGAMTARKYCEEPKTASRAPETTSKH